MTYKNSLAGLDLGGGKAVIIGDPRTDKTEALLRAYGRFVEALGGRYLTACDVGTYNADLDVVARETRFAHGRSEAYGGCGDSSVLTAYGVFQGMRAAAQHSWGAPTLAGRTVAVAGVGKVGSWLVGHLVDDGADVVVTDVDPAAVERRAGPAPAGEGGRRHRRRWSPRRTTSTRPAPSAARSTSGPWRRCPAQHRLRRREQPAGHPRRRRAAASGAASSTRPDYLVNAGGVIQVEDERHGFSFARAQSEGQRHLRRRAAGLRGGRRRGRLPRRRGRPAGRGADPLGRPAGDHPPAPLNARTRAGAPPPAGRGRVLRAGIRVVRLSET